MAKIALLIGVSEYGEGIPPLSAALNDVAAMQRVLQNPNLGGFEQVEQLLNPDAVAMRKAIHKLFKEAKKDDLVLLFFSGHGITNDEGHLYLATRITAKDDFEATAVDASYIQGRSNSCYAKRQVVILDACYSGAFAGTWRPKSVGVEDIKQQLGAVGRVVLTSSSATQKSFEQEGSTLSLYTQYLVEGIETGAADKDKNGHILIQELHDYAQAKVQEVKPNMTPAIILDREGFNIIIANAPKSSEAEYRKLVEQYAQNGELSELAYLVLKPKRQTFGLTDEKAEEIENEVLEPYRRRLANLELYKQAYEKAVKQQYPLNEHTLKLLKVYQQDVLGLRDEDVREIEKEITSVREAEYQQQLQQIQQQREEPNKTTTTPTPETDDLSSEKGVDYTRLRDLLKTGQWQEADQETLQVMLKVAGREKEGWLNVKSIENFPCTDLRTIDQLWVKYSSGRFGFSVQKRIWESVGGNPYADYDTWCKFGDRVGWREEEEWLMYNDLTFNLKAPQGNIPALVRRGWKGRSWWSSLFSRVETCKL
ncbi:caspase, EACC1-associated type [Anabaena sp. CA = ATCC 33047]|uniref:caspase, EACC1-associated type n=1 Tax=Anabaena sp. (strain CA / ATCC 33047) TaxID=52271 RepID=UPI0008326982|nr:GUN4 domain-containing protein [Anabaena sp. CA = ATCC 33047]